MRTSICIFVSIILSCGCKNNGLKSNRAISTSRRAKTHEKNEIYDAAYYNPDYTETGKVSGRINEMSTERLREEIGKVVVNHVQLDDIEIGTALDYLIQIGSQTHPDAPFRFPFDLSGAELNEDLKVTLHGRNVPYDELISLICNQGELRWRIKQGRIVIENK